MGLSIQEQLLKAGMVDKKQVKKAEHEKRIQSKKKKKGGGVADNSAAIRLQQQQAEKAKQDLKLNAERNQQAQRKADQAAAQQLISTNRLAVEEGDVVYHYVAGGQIKRISVDQTTADNLAEGRLGLAMHHKDIVLISADTVEKVLKRDKDLILAYNDPDQPEDDYPTDW